MNVRVEKQEKNLANILVDIPADDFDKATITAYNKYKNRFNIPGFRKGHASKAVIERFFGSEVFFDDAVNIILDETYPQALLESKLDVVSRPEIEVGVLKPHEGFTYTATVALRPEVILGDYKGVEVEKTDTTVYDSEVEEELKRVQDQNARIVSIEDPSREIKTGDIVIIDFEGSIDSVPFDGGKAVDYTLTIGSHRLVDNFEDQLIGHRAKDVVDVNVTFPADYRVTDVRGKSALFKVTIKEIREKELPPIDDDFASEVSEFETLEEYKASIKSDLGSRKNRVAVQENENKVIRKVVENASVDIPDLMVQTQLENTLRDYESRFRNRGVTLEQYLSSLGISNENFINTQREDIISRIKNGLVLEEIVKKENISAPKEAMDARLNELAKNYKTEADKVEELIGSERMENIKKDLAMQEAVDMLVSWAILKEPEKPPADDPAAESETPAGALGEPIDNLPDDSSLGKGAFPAESEESSDVSQENSI